MLLLSIRENLSGVHLGVGFACDSCGFAGILRIAIRGSLPIEIPKFLYMCRPFDFIILLLTSRVQLEEPTTLVVLGKVIEHFGSLVESFVPVDDLARERRLNLKYTRLPFHHTQGASRDNDRSFITYVDEANPTKLLGLLGRDPDAIHTNLKPTDPYVLRADKFGPLGRASVAVPRKAARRTRTPGYAPQPRPQAAPQCRRHGSRFVRTACGVLAGLGHRTAQKAGPARRPAGPRSRLPAARWRRPRYALSPRFQAHLGAVRAVTAGLGAQVALRAYPDLRARARQTQTRLFACGRGQHGELGLGERFIEEAEACAARDAKSRGADEREDAEGAGEGEPPAAELDDELFGLVGAGGDKRKPAKTRSSLMAADKGASRGVKGDAKARQTDNKVPAAFGRVGGAPCAFAPADIPNAPDGVEALACGHYHSAAVGCKSKMHAWGGDLSGQCGHGRAQNQWSPKWVMAVTGKSVSSVACGRTHTLIVAGGAVYAWGASSYGALGIGATAHTDQLNPVRLRGLGRTAIKQVAAGRDFSLCVSNSGDVYSWGRAHDGRLGRKGAKLTRASALPARLDGLPGKAATVCAGYGHSLCVMESGDLFAWGCNECGQLGTGDRRPRYVPAMVTTVPEPHASFEKMAVVDVAAGGSHSVVLGIWFNFSAGERRTQVLSWGRNDDGQAGLPLGTGSDAKASGRGGDGKPDPSLVLVPTPIPMFDQFQTDADARVRLATSVACGGAHTVVLAGGSAYAFGCGCYGQLGVGRAADGSAPPRSVRTPTLVSALQGHHVEVVACGAWHTLFVTGAPPSGQSVQDKWVPFSPTQATAGAAGTFGRQGDRSAPPRQRYIPRQRKKEGFFDKLLASFGANVAMCTGARKPGGGGARSKR